MDENKKQDPQLENSSEGQLKQIQRKRAKRRILTVLAVIIIIAVAVCGYFYFDFTHYFKTENASIAANTVTITPLMTGTVASWDVKEGDMVKKDQILGRQDISSLVNSSDINPAQLSSDADSIVGRSQVKTPIDGKIVQSNVIVGQTLAPSMTAAIVADTSHMFIKANIEETDIFKIKVGQKVNIKIDAYPGKHFTGYVESIGQTTQTAFSQFASMNTSGTYSKVTQLVPVKVSVINDENLPLLIGMNATVKITIK